MHIARRFGFTAALLATGCVFFCVAAILIAAGSVAGATPATRPDDLPAGQPNWLPLQGWAYQEDLVADDEKLVLPIQRESYWFLPYTHAATREVFDAYMADLNKNGLIKSSDKARDGIYWIPNAFAYPDTLEKIPADDRGVRLALQLSPGSGAVLKFSVTLSSTSRPVWREVEHRATDIIPLLFAVFVDGEPIVAPAGGNAALGGTQRSVELIGKNGGERKWDIRVDEPSVRALLPDKSPHTVAIVAAFSERQRVAFQGVDNLAFNQFFISRGFQPPKEHDGPQILVRSNVAKINWTGKSWETIETKK